MRKLGVAGTRKPGIRRRAGGGGKVCFGPNCGSGKKVGGKKRGR